MRHVGGTKAKPPALSLADGFAVLVTNRTSDPTLAAAVPPEELIDRPLAGRNSALCQLIKLTTPEFAMLKLMAVGVTALLVTASPLAHAQAPSAGVPATQLGTLTDMQMNLVKAALQLTPDQEKYWPPIEDAIRTEAQDREARIATAAKRIAELRQNPIEVLQTPDPVDLLQRRANALAQRSADLKMLASAWQPLYETLTPDQKKRMASLSLFVLRNMSNATQQRDLQCDEEQ